MIFNSTDNSVEKLLNYRGNDIEKCIRQESISIKIFDEYKDIAMKASKENPISKYLPGFSLSLLDKDGAFGLIEYSFKKELLTKE